MERTIFAKEFKNPIGKKIFAKVFKSLAELASTE